MDEERAVLKAGQRWQDLAACADAPYVWFPQEEQLTWEPCRCGCGQMHPMGTGDKEPRMAESRRLRRCKAICATCPVLSHCEEYVLSQPLHKSVTSGGVIAGRSGRELKRWYLNESTKRGQLAS